MVHFAAILIVQAIVPVLSHPDPHPAAQDAYAYVTDPSRSTLVMGQHDMEEIVYLQMIGAGEPAMGGFDLMDYSPSRTQHGQRTRGATGSWIRWAGADAFVTLSWHWNAPMFLLDVPGKEWWRGFYADATGFDLHAAVYEPESAEHMALLRDIDVIARELHTFRDAGVPVFWRPLHEASGGWFWWGAHGPEAYRDLWRLLHDRLVRHHGLNHLIWVYTVGDVSPNVDGAWYPGDDVVDVVSVDLYGDDPSTAVAWKTLSARFGGRKPLAVSETDRLPDPDRMAASGERWAWYTVWSGEHLRRHPAEDIISSYARTRLVTRDLLPDWRRDALPTPEKPTVTVRFDHERRMLVLEGAPLDRFRFRVFSVSDRGLGWGRGIGRVTWSASRLPPGAYGIRWVTESDQGVTWFQIE